MKNIFFLLLLFGMFACSEKELVWYSEDKDGLQFHTDPDKGLTTEKSFNFAMATYTDSKNNLRYYGDSLGRYRFEKVIVELQGFPTPDERPYKLTTVLLEGQDSTKQAEVIFDSYYSLAPNQLLDTISFTVLRPKARGIYKIGITVDTTDSDGFFVQGAKELSVLEIELKNTYEEPEDWKYREEYLGEFDEEKYAFMVTHSQDIFSRNNNYMWNNTDRYNLELRYALKRFNENAAPEDQKKFTFPETTKPVWWDMQLALLGEFSEEKHAFIKEVISKEGDKDENFGNNSKLYYWNLIFRQRAEEEKKDFTFPKFEEKAGWWNDQVLGNDWSIEKQEFVILHLFPMTGYQPNDDTWTFAASVLRMEMDRYNQENPKDPLKYEFGHSGEPEWWNEFADMFGPWSETKQDIIVTTLLQRNIEDNGRYDINDLLTGNRYWVSERNPYIVNAIADYNKTHPDNAITDYPGGGNVAPIWWNDKYLGEYSSEKEDFIRATQRKIAGWDDCQEWSNFAAWGPILRYELAINPDAPKDIEFPAAIKPEFWDNCPQFGAWSESKFVFINLYHLKTQYWLPDPDTFKGLTSSWLADMHKQFYKEFMETYKAANPEPFTFE